MSIYYVVRLHIKDERSGERHYLKLMPCADPACPFHPQAKKGYPFDGDRYLWKEEAEKMLLRTMKEKEAVERYKIVSGQICHVNAAASPVGPVLYPGEDPEKPPEPVSEPKAVVEAQPASNPFLDQCEAILAAGEACDLGDDSDHDAYHEAALFFYENAEELIETGRELDKLKASLPRPVAPVPEAQ